MRTELVEHRFVEFIPERIEAGVLYVSLRGSVAIHKCCCGCGNDVVTPLGRSDWKMIFDGDTVSLHPSIGNWRMPCRSHYWIQWNRVVWLPSWSEAGDNYTPRRIDQTPPKEHSTEKSAQSAELAWWEVVARYLRRRM